jgi:hypothetical protein
LQFLKPGVRDAVTGPGHVTFIRPASAVKFCKPSLGKIPAASADCFSIPQ